MIAILISSRMKSLENEKTFNHLCWNFYTSTSWSLVKIDPFNFKRLRMQRDILSIIEIWAEQMMMDCERT